MGTREDLKLYPCFKLENGMLVQIEPPEYWNMYFYEMHHFVRRQQFARNPSKYATLQKLILLSKQAHKDCHAYHSNFEERYGVPLKEVMYLEKR